MIQIENNIFKIFFILFPILRGICRRIFAKPQKLLKRHEYNELHVFLISKQAAKGLTLKMVVLKLSNLLRNLQR